MAPAVLPRHSLKTRITLATLCVFLASLWSLSLYATLTLRKDTERLLNEQQQSTVAMLATQVNRELEGRLTALENVATSMTPELFEHPEQMQRFIEQRPDLNTLFNSRVFVTRADGDTIASVPFSSERIGVNFMDRDYLAGALKEGKTTIGRPVLGRTTPAPVLVMAAPIRSGKDRVIGALVGSINLAVPNFFDQITQSQYGKTGGYILISRQHRLIVTATEKSRIMNELQAIGMNPAMDRYTAGYEGSAIYVNSRGVEVLSSAKNIPVADWFIVAVLPTDEAFAPIRDMRRRMALATLLLSFLAAGLTWWVLKAHLSPLFVAAESLAARAASGQPPQPLPIARRDEIGDLISGFNQLLETLRLREESLKESEAHFRLLTEGVSDVVWKQDRDFRLTYISPADERMRGYRADEVIGHHLFEQTNDEGIAHIQRVLQKRLEAQQRGMPQDTVTFVVQQRCRNGSLL